MTCILEILDTCRKYSLVFLHNLFTYSYRQPAFLYFCTYPATCHNVSVVSRSLLRTLFMHRTVDVKSDLALCLCRAHFAQLPVTDSTAMQEGMRPPVSSLCMQFWRLFREGTGAAGCRKKVIFMSSTCFVTESPQS